MDLIDKRNEKEKLKRSIVKYWNVAYHADKKAIENSGPECPAEDSGKTRDYSYNVTTGARSGDYGKKPVAEEDAGKIDEILGENKFELEKILKDTDSNEGPADEKGTDSNEGSADEKDTDNEEPGNES